jgi:hypothetical protein
MATSNQSLTRLATKTARGSADYTLSLSLDVGDTVASAAVSGADPSVDIAVTRTSSSVITLNASGGISGIIYYFGVPFTTAAGRTFKRYLALPVDQVG